MGPKPCPAFEVVMNTEFYRTFSLIFHRPDRDFTQYLRSGFLTDIQCLGDEAIAGFSRFLDEHQGQDDDEFFNTLAVEYTRLFINGMPRATCLPYESVYREGTVMGASTLAVKARYSQAGLQVLDGFGDLPDHVAVELEFLYYLLDKGDGEAHDSFLRDHLSQWVPAFSEAIDQNGQLFFYRHAARVLAQTVGQVALRAS